MWGEGPTFTFIEVTFQFNLVPDIQFHLFDNRIIVLTTASVESTNLGAGYSPDTKPIHNQTTH